MKEESKDKGVHVEARGFSVFYGEQEAVRIFAIHPFCKFHTAAIHQRSPIC
jgi:hypothetical protein